MIKESTIRDCVGFGYKIELRMEMLNLVLVLTDRTGKLQIEQQLPMSDHLHKADDCLQYMQKELLKKETNHKL